MIMYEKVDPTKKLCVFPGLEMKVVGMLIV